MSRLGRILTAATASVALVVSGCATSPTARLSKDLIPAPTLQAAPWALRTASGGPTVHPFGAQPSGAPLDTPNLPKATAVATRQWLRGTGALAAGPLAEGIFSVIDRAAQYRSAADAQTLVADLLSGAGSGSHPITGIPGATLLGGPFAFDVPGGQITGRQDLVIIERGAYVLTVLVVGGGSRPTSSDVQALATLQAATIPASLS